MSDEQDKSDEPQPEQQDTPESGNDETEQDRQLYFEQLAAVHNSILEGVITYW